MIKANGKILLYREKKVKMTQISAVNRRVRNRLIIVNQDRASVRIIKHDRLVIGAIGGCNTFRVRFAVESGLFCCALPLANNSIRGRTVDDGLLDWRLLGLLWDLDISSKSDCFAIAGLRTKEL
jgi:hypothetical protein